MQQLPLTRARKMCVIFYPLDMKGLIGAATVMGSLTYGAVIAGMAQSICIYADPR